MKKLILLLLPLACIVFAACKKTNDARETSAAIKRDSIFPRGAKITNNNFKGFAYLQMLMDADSANQTTVGNVTFEPGARTKWHLHPAGQILLVTDGVGYYQEKGHRKKNTA